MAGFVRGGQSSVGRCRGTLWLQASWPTAHSAGTTVLAGHNWCGYQYWAYLPKGAVVALVGRWGRARYRVTRHVYIGRESGNANGLFFGDLVLVTCLDRGMSLTYAVRIG